MTDDPVALAYIALVGLLLVMLIVRTPND